MNPQFRVILFNKPYNVLCQFTPEPGQVSQCLADYIDKPNFYCAGRLDKDSEGLLVLTNSGKLQHLISHPKHKLDKTYWVQVEGDIGAGAINTLAAGVRLKDGVTQACSVKSCDEPDIWPRQPPIRVRQSIPTHWIEITLREGKNRQVRRMTAAAGFPTLRLIRVAIGPWRLQQLQPGEFCELNMSVSDFPENWRRYLLESPTKRSHTPKKATTRHYKRSRNKQ